MDELIKQGQWWWPFLVPIATGGLALFGSWWGSRLGKTTEHAQWLRNEKIETYSQYVEVIRRGDLMMNNVIIGAISTEDAAKSNDHTGGSRLRLISPNPVREAALNHSECRKVLWDFLGKSPEEISQSAQYDGAVKRLDEARKHLVHAMSRDLGITDV